MSAPAVTIVVITDTNVLAQADGYKLVLAEKRYTMPFASFAERR